MQSLLVPPYPSEIYLLDTISAAIVWIICWAGAFALIRRHRRSKDAGLIWLAVVLALISLWPFLILLAGVVHLAATP